MKIVSYEHESGIRGGVLIEDTVYDLELLLQGSGQAVHGATTSVREFLELYGDRLEAVSAEVSALAGHDPEAHVGARADVRLTTPVPDPSKVLCIGLNYKDHVAETGRALPEYPDVFAKFASTMVGPDDDIGGARVSENLDFEGELAVVIGRRASEVSEEEALGYVAAVAPLNDVTARDLQYRGTQWLAGKAVDGSTPWGPALVTLDEVGDPQNLDLATRVNGIEVQRSNTSYQIFPIARIVSYLSGFLTLEPGDVIATGTPQGIGAKRNPPVWLEPGDTVEIDIENVGLLRNTVGKPQP
ncbi:MULTISPECIES: fumarylacetoacetate hydrolase family protein [Paenarthrobacter]|jgi:2-keto-4-pentenoate hydratase/2-oxohepta-3-ene-1,7-dioic acid hydratase in catechol pathway|uniref:fumarylacetoacetate hydrolase family protein n=1 Tax=Paenarthrobacter TaxID=1742992 RepID=UPI00140D1D27|nr:MULTISPECIES: fumarylacetoacetate hydrolase family protein [Paenarthrobacter]MCX8454869.1 fumarylacetoacetate hydrolase family protein [Paenarthrobacter ureafaciens]MCY0973054.1 fumarylacetoacetate hydrolase family protein [Paenarthrobacter ureafaciens]QOT17278.1 fumarylacetoacetate hydrolase family protein [Paenarthrobacter sp. YJN-5]UOD82989.1 fumarylacetoacetate hydrolase family protein [Paenarthrobacter ureafaciens]WNZ02696.1 fumarylacetoacetate hydrolase family protein [Paenarthrobacte